jgi:hypothetical protein
MTVPTSPHATSPNPGSPTRLRAQRGESAQVAQYIRDLSSREGGRSYDRGSRRRRKTAVQERG